MLGVAILDVATGGGPLEIAVEFDAVGRIEVDALHLAAQALALGQASHDLQAVAENHAIGPVGAVLVELGLGVGQAVEVGEEIELLAVLLPRRAQCRVPRLKAPEVVDKDFGVDLFLNVEGRRLHHEAGPVLPILAAPDELGVAAALFVLHPGGLPGYATRTGCCSSCRITA